MEIKQNYYIGSREGDDIITIIFVCGEGGKNYYLQKSNIILLINFSNLFVHFMTNYHLFKNYQIFQISIPIYYALRRLIRSEKFSKFYNI